MRLNLQRFSQDWVELFNVIWLLEKLEIESLL